MSSNNVCRLCFSHNGQMDLFSDIGIELKMVRIIAEHFKCEVNEADVFPNVVCQDCWFTTESFHELFEKSQVAKSRFLNSMVKVENDIVDAINTTGSDHDDNIVKDACEEQPIDVADFKTETNLECEDNFAIETISGFDGYDDDLDKNGMGISLESDSESYIGGNEEIPLKKTAAMSTGNNTSNKKKKRRRSAKEKQELDEKFDKFFSENEHLFDMTCDICSTVWKTYKEARAHYITEHNSSNCSIRCCNVRMRSRTDVLKHVQFRHTDPNQSKCKECGKSFTSILGLQKHIQRKHPTEDEICEICHKTFATRRLLNRHLKLHANRSNISEQDDQEKLPDYYSKFIAENFDMSCDRCEAIFTTFHDARCHYKEAHDDRTGYIKCCKYKLRKLSFVVDHIDSHLKPTNFKCSCHNKSFSSAKTYNEHLMRQSRAYICDMCNRQFRTRESISKHFVTAHLNLELKFQCEICHKRFKIESLLKSHMYGVHRDKKPKVTCEICGKSFYAQFHLNKHMRTHIDKSERLAERTQCEHCGEWLMSKSGIYYHQQIHTSGVQKCNHCDMELPNKPSLMDHIRKYHRERKHKCSYCEKAFSTRGDLKKHEEFHTRHNQYPCQYCDKVFTVPSSHLTHLKRNHLEQHKLSKLAKRMQS